MCKNIPHGQAQDPCAVVFQSGVDVNDDPDAVESVRLLFLFWYFLRF